MGKPNPVNSLFLYLFLVPFYVLSQWYLVHARYPQRGCCTLVLVPWLSALFWHYGARSRGAYHRWKCWTISCTVLLPLALPFSRLQPFWARCGPQMPGVRTGNGTRKKHGP